MPATKEPIPIARAALARRRRGKHRTHRGEIAPLAYTRLPLYSADQLEFMAVVQNYKEAKRRPFPTLCEVLDLLVGLGYQKPRDGATVPFSEGM